MKHSFIKSMFTVSVLSAFPLVSAGCGDATSPNEIDSSSSMVEEPVPGIESSANGENPGELQNGSSASQEPGESSASQEPGEIPASSADISVIESSSAGLLAPTGSFTDPRDGKSYKLTKIGGQTWMAENLAYGDSVLFDLNDARNACPENFHLPALREFRNMVDFLGGEKVAGTKLKSTTGWPNDEYGNWNGTDDYGFNAKPVESGDGKGTDENFWTSTRNTRNGTTGDFFKLNAHPTSMPEEGNNHLNNGPNFGACDGSTKDSASAGLVCYINGEPDTKLSIRCLSNYEECGSITIDNTKQFCQDGIAYDFCRERVYDVTKYECKNDTLYEKASGTVFKYTWLLLNPDKEYGLIQDERDGQFYKTLKVDGVTWFAENLNYASEGSVCHYEQEKFCDVYGRLYTKQQYMAGAYLDSTKIQGLCPKGSHLATAKEFRAILEKYKMKGLFTSYAPTFEDDDFDDNFGILTNESGLAFLENGSIYRDEWDWDSVNMFSYYAGSNYSYYLYFRWAMDGVSEPYIYPDDDNTYDDNRFASVRCVVD